MINRIFILIAALTGAKVIENQDKFNSILILIAGLGGIAVVVGLIYCLNYLFEYMPKVLLNAYVGITTAFLCASVTYIVIFIALVTGHARQWDNVLTAFKIGAFFMFNISFGMGIVYVIQHHKDFGKRFAQKLPE